MSSVLPKKKQANKAGSLSHLTIATLTNKFSSYTANHRFIRRWSTHAAVAIIFQQRDDDLYLLMQKRAERNGDPWSGDMSFPGGKATYTDKSSWHTACRETMEEIGLSIGESQYLGQLTDMVTLTHQMNRLMLVTPHVCVLHETAEFKLNKEVSNVVWIPFSLFLDPIYKDSFKFKIKRWHINTPCYYYQQFKVWGLSLAMIDKLKRVINYR